MSGAPERVETAERCYTSTAVLLYPLLGMGNNDQSGRRRRNWWLLLLVLPFLGLCFPQMYARATPSLWGFPFFYWYQFAWVVAGAVLMGVVYWKTRTPDEETGAPK